MARAGDTESGQVLRWEFDSEPQALEMVDRLLRADTAGQWREQDRSTPPPASDAGEARRGPAQESPADRNARRRYSP